MSLWFLFFSAFIASTLFPGGSEALLAYLVLDNRHSLILLISVATLGNTLGAMTSWGIGRLIALRYPAKSLKKESHKKALSRLKQYGSPILLLSWLPVIGDPLCVAAGWLRIHWLPSLVYISIGKFARYLVLVWVFM